MKSTKRMKVEGGWLYQVTTEVARNEQIRDAMGTYVVYPAVCAIAEALCFVPFAK